MDRLKPALDAIGIGVRLLPFVPAVDVDPEPAG